MRHCQQSLTQPTPVSLPLPLASFLQKSLLTLGLNSSTSAGYVAVGFPSTHPAACLGQRHDPADLRRWEQRVHRWRQAGTLLPWHH